MEASLERERGSWTRSRGAAELSAEKNLREEEGREGV